jgi:acetylornithine aminotransferase
VPFGDEGALEKVLADGVTVPGKKTAHPVAAVFLEPIQGEAGVRALPEGYLPRARELTTEAGALLVLDEVQTGVGRTGRWFAHQHPHLGGGVIPDVVTLAKGLGGGFPIGALVAFGEGPATLLGPGQHGTTFGGNPVAAAAALATLHVIERDGLLLNATRVGQRLRDGILGLSSPLVGEVRGEGLLLAVQLEQPVAAAVAASLLEKGVILNAVAPDALRLAPPLVLTEEQADWFVSVLGEVFDEVSVAESAGVGR